MDVDLLGHKVNFVVPVGSNLVDFNKRVALYTSGSRGSVIDRSSDRPVTFWYRVKRELP